jgi:hypothetical protein
LSLDDCCERQVAEYVCEVLPSELVAVFPKALIVKAIDFVDFPIFVVA